MMSLHIEFQRASKFFDVTSFEEKNITACLVARVYIDDPMVGRLAVGYLIHMVREQVRECCHIFIYCLVRIIHVQNVYLSTRKK